MHDAPRAAVPAFYTCMLHSNPTPLPSCALLVEEKPTLPLVLVCGDGGVLPDDIPVNLLPPCPQESRLAPDAVVVQPHVLPCVDTQQRHDVGTAEGLLGLVFLLRCVTEGANLVQLLVRVGVVGVQVVRLPPVV